MDGGIAPGARGNTGLKMNKKITIEASMSLKTKKSMLKRSQEQTQNEPKLSAQCAH